MEAQAKPQEKTGTLAEALSRHPWYLRVVIFLVTRLGAGLLLLWFKTLRTTYLGGEREKELRRQGPMFYALWHRGVVWALYLWRWRNGWYLASASKDGEWAVGVIRAFGNYAVRGSSSRGGKEALAKMVEELKAGRSGGLIPDAPRGPARVCKPGVLVVSQRSGIPVVPVAMAAERCWRGKNWDQTVLPKPFSRCVVKFGEPFHVDPALSGEALDARLKEFDRVLNALTDECEAFFAASPGFGKGPVRDRAEQ